MLPCQKSMKTKREKLELEYSAVLIGSMIVGILVLVFCALFFILAEVWGHDAMKSPIAQPELFDIVRLLAFGMLPALAIASLLAAYTMWRYRKLIRNVNAA